MPMRHLNATLCFLLSVAVPAQHANASDLKVRVLDSAGQPAADVPIVILATQDPLAEVLTSARTRSDGFATITDAERWFVSSTSGKVPALRLDFPLQSDEWLPLCGGLPTAPLQLRLPACGRITIHMESVAGEALPIGFTPILLSQGMREPAGRELASNPIAPSQRTITFEHVGLDQRMTFELRRGSGNYAAWTLVNGPTRSDPDVDVTVWPSNGLFGTRAIVTGRMVDPAGEALPDCAMRIDLPFYTFERGESDSPGIKGSARTWPIRTGPDGRFQVALPLTDVDYRLFPVGVSEDFVDQIGSLWGFDDASRRAFECRISIRGCHDEATIDLGDLRTVEHDLILRGNVQTKAGEGVEYPLLSLVDRDGRAVQGRLWYSATGWFAFVSYGQHVTQGEPHTKPWTLVVSTRDHPTLRQTVDPAQNQPVIATVDR